MGFVISIDAGTTGVRAFVIDESGRPVAVAYREFPQYFPQPGWVEHDANEIWDAVQACLAEVATYQPVAAVGITNQRETVVVWSRATGEPLHRALVWQDRRTADVCAALLDHLSTVRAKTGLVLDPYFSATKLKWLLDRVDAPRDDVMVGTIDTWLLWKLTGTYATDVTNASRTLLCDIGTRRWDDDLMELFGVTGVTLPEIRPSSGRLGVTADGVPVSGIAGDQQAALFGQACFSPGMTKNTYGTGSFVLMNVGPDMPAPVEGLLTTVGWELASGATAYALEGAIFVTGAAIQWLRDGLGLIEAAPEIGPLAGSVADTDGVFVVPAFTGLGSPWWDPYARGAIVGITRGTTKAHIARAVVESMVLSTRDVVDAMCAAAGREVTTLRVDGGASVMDLLCQMQADQLQVPVERPAITETTALGAAYLAGLAEGVWSSTDELAALWSREAAWRPQVPKELADLRLEQWHNAVERSRHWADVAAE
ncbi:MAG TPA: glycerol kinase GlpK [Acidimicrobiales bacterium]|nr:glycerol kinase GlpK [Acidimicrobiales bacterium]